MVTFSSGRADFRVQGAGFSPWADAAPEWEQELRTISASRLVCSGSKPAEIQTDRNAASVLCLNEKETSGYKTHQKKKKIRRKKEGREEVWLQAQQQSSPTQWVVTAVAKVSGQAHWLEVQNPVGAQAQLDHTGARRAHSSMASQPGSSHTGHLGIGDRHRRSHRVRPREGSQRKGSRSKGQHSSSIPDP